MKYIVRIIFVFATAMLIKLFCLDIYCVPTASMQPTIKIDDKILVQKCLFTPQKESVLAFRLPQNPDELYIKRCKGMPLDTVWIDANRNYQIQKNVMQGIDNAFFIIPKKGLKVKIDFKNITFYKPLIERDEDGQIGVIGGQLYINGIVAQEYTFQQNYYFMLGDNPNSSVDSRTFGVVGEGLMLGKMIF